MKSSYAILWTTLSPIYLPLFTLPSSPFIVPSIPNTVIWSSLSADSAGSVDLLCEMKQHSKYSQQARCATTRSFQHSWTNQHHRGNRDKRGTTCGSPPTNSSWRPRHCSDQWDGAKSPTSDHRSQIYPTLGRNCWAMWWAHKMSKLREINVHEAWDKEKTEQQNTTTFK